MADLEFKPCCSTCNLPDPEPPCPRYHASHAMDWVVKYHSAPIDKTTAANALRCFIPAARMYATCAGQRSMIDAADDNARKTLGDEIDDYWFDPLPGTGDSNG